jgi:hypothetical protein
VLEPDSFLGLFSLAIPAVAIIGAFTVAIVRIITEHRMIHMAQKERLAAIERGLDPSKLPPIGAGGRDPAGLALDRWGYGNGSPLRRAQGLLIGGLVTVAVGVGVSLFLHMMETEKNAWGVGLIPMLVGAALLIGAAVIWPRGNARPQGPPSKPTA